MARASLFRARPICRVYSDPLYDWFRSTGFHKIDHPIELHTLFNVHVVVLVACILFCDHDSSTS